MKIFILLFLILLLPATPLYANLEWNPFTNRWETVPDNSDYELRWNGFEDTYSYEPKGSELEWNGFEDIWDWKPPDTEHCHEKNFYKLTP